MAVLYTDYYPIPGDGSYTKNVAPRLADGTLVGGLRDCATPGYFFQLSDHADMVAAMGTMFSTTTTGSNLRLSR